MGEPVSISVVIPMYNSQHYIRQTLLSIVNQSFRNFEIIVIDDGSTDESNKVARQVLDEYDHVNSTIIAEENKGLPGARNTGIRAAKGKYICFIDSDDILDKLHLESMFNLIEQDDLDVVHSFYELTSEGNREGTKCSPVKGVVYSRGDVVSYALKRKPAIIVCGFLIRLDFLKSNELFFNESLRYGEDSDYIWKTIFTCERIGCTKNATYKYLIHDNSIMKTISEEKANIFIEEFGKTIEYIKSLGNSNDAEIEKIYYREILGFLHAYSICSDQEAFFRMSNMIDPKSLYLALKSFPDLRVKIISFLYKCSPNWFYKVFHK